MLVSDLIGKIHIAYKGKDASLAPVPGDAKYSMYLSRANDNRDRWVEDPAVDNPDLFSGDIDVSLTDGVFELPEGVARVTDPVMYGDKEIPLISYKDRHTAKVGAYVVGLRGARKLYVVNPDNYPINSFLVGLIDYLDPMTSQADDVQCSIPRWLALQTAAQLAEQDPAKEDLAGSLFNQAAAEYTEGLARAKNQLRGSNRTMKIVVGPRIGGL